MFKASFLNVVLRGSTVAGKFVLLLAMARYFDPGDVGVYGLFAGTVAIAIYVLGLDFYVYNTREILAREGIDRGARIRDQAVFHLVAYAITLPLLLSVFLAGFLPWRYVALFYGVLVLEHISTETYRLLIVLSRPVAGNFVLFLRTGAWILPVLLGVLFFHKLRVVEWVLLGWLVGAATSVVVATWLLSSLPWRAIWSTAIDWRGIRAGMVGSLPFFAGTLALRGVEYADRYFVEHYAGTALVGVYTFFTSVSRIVQTFTITGVIELLYPRAVRAFQANAIGEYRAVMRRMGLGSVAVVLLGCAAVAMLIHPMLRLVGRPLYITHLDLLWVLLASAVIGITAWIPRYALFVRRKDKSILVAYLVGLLTSLSANAWLVPHFGPYGAAIASLIANTGIAIAMLAALVSARRPNYAAS